MRSCHYTITPNDVQHRALDVLQAALRLADHGPKCTARAVLTVLAWAAACGRSIAAACAALRQAPSDQAVRNALLATLPEYARLQAQLNQALADGLPKVLRGRKADVAIDLTLLPYYGLPAHDARELYRSKQKAGTRYFHAYATAYVILRGCRYTLGLRGVWQADPWEDLVGDLLRQVRKLGVKVRLLLLDRGFYSVGVIRYLQAARCPFIMPAIRRGHRPQHPDGASGTWVFTTRPRSGWGTYTLHERRSQRTATVTIAVCCHRLPPTTRSGRPIKKRRVVWLYALWGVQPKSVAWVREKYRQRFAIETTYRQLGQARIKTSTRQPVLRLLIVGLALVLRNVWVWLHWQVLAKKRRGWRRVDLNQLTFEGLLHWLQRVAEECFGLTDQVVSERPFPA